jgi:uncharacterized integral membrane protein
MQVLVWIFRLVIVLVLVWFAVKNSQLVELHGLPGYVWQASLIFVVLVAFVAGVLIGLLAWLPTVVRQRRELGRLRKKAAAALPVPPPAGAAESTDLHGV